MMKNLPRLTFTGRVTALLRLDFHVLATLLLRGWSILAGALTIFGIPFWLTLVEQGYYFTFASILASQIFFELGFGYVLTQFAATQMSELQWGRHDLLAGSVAARARLGSLIVLAHRVYARLAVVFFVLISIGGWLFFNAAPPPAPPLWVGAWLLAVVAAAGNLYVSPFMAIVEGTGKIGQVAALRTRLSVLGYAGAWLAFFLGAGLLAIPLISGTLFVGSCLWLIRQRRSLLSLCRHSARHPQHGVSWRSEIFPLQWRIAASWASGYLIFQLFNPILFRQFGVQEAGRVGLVLAVCSSLVTLSISWLSAKVPLLVQQIRSGHITAAKALFIFQSRSASICFGVLGLSLIVLVIAGQQFPLVQLRLPSLGVVVCIVVASFVNQVIFSLASYMRAHGVEPLMWPSIVTAVATVLVLCTVGRHSVQAAMAGYAVVQLFICLPWVSYLFFTKFWMVSRDA